MRRNKTESEKDIELLNGLAQVHLVFGMHTTALHLLELSCWLDDTNEKTLKLIARCYFNLKNAEQVIQVLDRIDSLEEIHEPDEEELLLRARSYTLLGNQDAARRVLTGA